MKKLRIRHGVLLIIHHLASGHTYVPKKKVKITIFLQSF